MLGQNVQDKFFDFTVHNRSNFRLKILTAIFGQMQNKYRKCQMQNIRWSELFTRGINLKFLLTNDKNLLC